MNEKVSFWKKPVSMKIFAISGIVLILSFLVYRTVSFCSVDYFYMVATGKDIVENGNLYTNSFTVNDLGIIIQQWLYCVYLYLISPLGQYGMVLSILFVYGALFFVGYKILRMKNLSSSSSLLVLLLSFVISGTGVYLLEIRPEALTMLLVFIEIYALEKYKLSNKTVYLFLLPVVMLVEINAHGSMWWLHYVILFGYLMPNFFKKRFEQAGFNKKQMISILIAALIMTGTMFVNPYGYKMIMYVPWSFMAQTFNYVKIAEMQKPELFGPVGLFVILLVILLTFLLIKTKIHSYSFYFSVFFLAVGLLANRNACFFYISGFYLGYELFDYFRARDKKLNFSGGNTRGIIVVFTITTICFATLSFLYMGSLGNYQLNDAPVNILSYLNENVDKHTAVYTGFDSGSYLEYFGYDNVYVDTRPEVYSKIINGKKDVLKEYSKFAFVRRTGTEFVSKEEYDEYVGSYGFKYFIFYNDIEMQNYLDSNPKYEYIMDDDGFKLYKLVENI